MSGAAVYQGRKFPEHTGLKFDMPPKLEKPQPETGPFPVPLPPKSGDGQARPTPASTPEPTPDPVPAPATTEQPVPEPAPTPAPAPEQKQSEAPADPRAASLVEMASAPIDNPGRAALLKPVEKLTEGEMKDMINHAQGDYRGFRSGDPLKAHTYEKVQDGLALGRFNTFARQAQSRGNADGLEAATNGAFGPLFRASGDDKSPKVEGGVLQETLNTIGPQHHDDWENLKVDNWVGPKIRTAFGRGLGLL